MRPSFGLLCCAELWGAPTRAAPAGPLQSPGNTPPTCLRLIPSLLPHPTLPQGPLPVSTLEVAQPQGLSSGWAMSPHVDAKFTKLVPWEKAPCSYKKVREGSLLHPPL